MLYREIIAVCSQIHTKHIKTLCGQNVEIVNVKPGGAYSNHYCLNRSKNPDCTANANTAFITALLIPMRPNHPDTKIRAPGHCHQAQQDSIFSAHFLHTTHHDRPIIQSLRFICRCPEHLGSHWMSRWM